MGMVASPIFCKFVVELVLHFGVFHTRVRTGAMQMPMKQKTLQLHGLNSILYASCMLQTDCAVTTVYSFLTQTKFDLCPETIINYS